MTEHVRPYRAILMEKVCDNLEKMPNETPEDRLAKKNVAKRIEKLQYGRCPLSTYMPFASRYQIFEKLVKISTGKEKPELSEWEYNGLQWDMGYTAARQDSVFGILQETLINDDAFNDSEISHDERIFASEAIQMIAHRTMDHRTYRDLRRIVRQRGKTHYNDRLELWSTETFKAMAEYLRSIEKEAA